MAELYEEPGRPQPPTEEQRDEYDRMARRAIEASLELADRMEAA